MHVLVLLTIEWRSSGVSEIKLSKFDLDLSSFVAVCKIDDSEYQYAVGMQTQLSTPPHILLLKMCENKTKVIEQLKIFCEYISKYS